MELFNITVTWTFNFKSRGEKSTGRRRKGDMSKFKTISVRNLFI